MRRNSNSSNSQIPLTQSPCITPKSQLAQGQTQNPAGEEQPSGALDSSAQPLGHSYPCTRLCQTPGFFIRRIMLT